MSDITKSVQNFDFLEVFFLIQRVLPNGYIFCFYPSEKINNHLLPK